MSQLAMPQPALPPQMLSPDVSAPTPEAPTPQIPNPQAIMQQRMKLLGSILHLMMHSPLHRMYPISALEERIIPSLLHNQFRYYEMNGTPIGFVNWAWLSDKLESQYCTGQYELALDEWVGGSHLWFPEFMAPFDHTAAIVRDLRKNVFKKGTPAKALRISATGEVKGVSKYRL